MIEILFAKTKPEAKIPTKRMEDAGYDIFACFAEDYLVIEPHQTIKIPTGIASCFPQEYCMILKERGSTGTQGFGQRSGVIDSGYRNEWLVPMTNHNEKPLLILKEEFKSTAEYGELIQSRNFLEYSYNKAISQALLVPVPLSQSVEISYEELLEHKSERMLEGFGSTNK